MITFILYFLKDSETKMLSLFYYFGLTWLSQQIHSKLVTTSLPMPRLQLKSNVCFAVELFGFVLIDVSDGVNMTSLFSSVVSYMS